MSSINVAAGGNINPSVFVKLDTSNDNSVVQASAASDFVIGVSTPSTKAFNGTVAAASGDPINVFGLGDVCLLLCGSGGWTRGDSLTSDANGAGVTASSGNIIGAKALESTAYQAFGRVMVWTGKV